MMVATDGNSRTTVACASGSLNDGLSVAFCASRMRVVSTEPATFLVTIETIACST